MTNCLRPRTTALLLLTLSLAACESLNDAASKAAENFQSAMQGAHDASGKLQTGYTVRGRVLLRDGQTLTCFNGITTGYLGSPTMASPGEGSYDPRTGKAMIAPDYAKLYIDMLGILEEKTKGNLDEAEQKVMTRSVSELRVEYVELVKAIDKAVAEGKISPQQIAGPGASPTPGGGIVTPGQARPGPSGGAGFGTFGS